MKVILAGCSKTGTKATASALAILGYKIYDNLEQFARHGDDWMKIMKSDSSVDDLKIMFKDVDAAAEAPFFHYWEELHQAFPDAKIILTIRDEESWYKSMRSQMNQGEKDVKFQLGLLISPTGRKYFKFLQACFSQMWECHWARPFTKIESNELTMKIRYRQHNEYVVKHAPNDKLLVYRVEDEWGPLCKFLGKEIPDKPFPRLNASSTAVDEAPKHPIMVNMKKEMMVLGVLSGIGVIGIYLSYKRFSL